MNIVCDHCGEIIGKTQYSFTERSPMKFKNYEACCEECLKAILHEQGIKTYPGTDKRSLRLSKTALTLSIIAVVIQVIRTVAVLL